MKLKKVKRIGGYRNGRLQEFWKFLLILFLKRSGKRRDSSRASRKHGVKSKRFNDERESVPKGEQLLSSTTTTLSSSEITHLCRVLTFIVMIPNKEGFGQLVQKTIS
jgi:aspartate carbamoyltransferase catalytic subunit